MGNGLELNKSEFPRRRRRDTHPNLERRSTNMVNFNILPFSVESVYSRDGSWYGIQKDEVDKKKLNIVAHTH